MDYTQQDVDRILEASEKATKGNWRVRSTGRHWNNPALEHLEICYSDDDECICDTVYERPNADLMAGSPILADEVRKLRAENAALKTQIDGLDKWPIEYPDESGEYT
jgi:hypothetical protein